MHFNIPTFLPLLTTTPTPTTSRYVFYLFVVFDVFHFQLPYSTDSCWDHTIGTTLRMSDAYSAYTFCNSKWSWTFFLLWYLATVQLHLCRLQFTRECCQLIPKYVMPCCWHFFVTHRLRIHRIMTTRLQTVVSTMKLDVARNVQSLSLIWRTKM